MARSTRRDIRPPDRFGEAADDDELRGITSSEDDDDDDGVCRGRRTVVVADDDDDSSSDESDGSRSLRDSAPLSDRPNSDSECDGELVRML